ncbi:pentapeptide repeat-containing protein [Leptolyngbya iicbica]|uniref:Pentapeptide repeat-containing protein n=2 Tax=Cyanophyceae TaxID=3028117 RepID=A0A4Q7EL42_9CYAN|nr:pentapeptide repeat-containing protein [Leptolyngbya sp. LK]RZM82529.1 pentapeptide repeat-containing protein [Leptolyngbya sp. LK]
MPTREQLIQYWKSKGRWKYGALALTALLIAAGLGFFFDAPGVRECVTSANLERCYLLGKTFWDWLGLIGVPLSLAILGYVLQRQQQKRAADEEKEEILQTYFDRISVLLVDKNLLAIASKAYPRTKKSKDQSEELLKTIQSIQAKSLTFEEKELLAAAVDVIRARTLSILRRFEHDGVRKGNVVRFLIETEVIGKAKMNLSDADLRDADLCGTNLINAYLSHADLRDANLSYAWLRGAYLGDANLEGADLEGAYFDGADLGGTNLSVANLSVANLSVAKLNGADIICANLRHANLNHANLEGANLGDAYLEGANLSFASLIDTNLSGTKLVRTNLRDIRWNKNTQWPVPEEVAKARNIPEVLKQQLGIE